MLVKKSCVLRTTLQYTESEDPKNLAGVYIITCRIIFANDFYFSCIFSQLDDGVPCPYDRYNALMNKRSASGKFLFRKNIAITDFATAKL